MATGANNLATLNGNFKEVYADSIRDLLPASFKLQNAISFTAKSQSTGNKYHQPVILAHEHGTTYAGENVDDAFDLAVPSAGQIKDATIQGTEFGLRSRLSYNAAVRAVTGKAAFMDSTELLVKNMTNSVAKRVEFSSYYGQQGIAKVGSVSGGVVTIPSAAWAPGIWSGARGMLVQTFTAGVQSNTTGDTSWKNGATAALYVTAVDMSAKTITLSATKGGAPATLTGVLAGDDIFVAGSFGNEFLGLKGIITPYASGTLFGIPAGYEMFTGNSYNVGGALSTSKILDAVDLAVEKGLDEDCEIHVNIRAFNDLLADVIGKRVYDSSYSPAGQKTGAQAVEINGQAGKVTVVPSLYVKEGDAFLINPKDFMYVGATDITFNRPGQSDEFFMDLENNAGYELRAYANQALFCEAPGRQVALTGIVNNAA